MFNRSRPVHSAFESLQVAIRSPRMTERGRPAHFATNEQITALSLAHPAPRSGRRAAGLFEVR